ncbi:MAG: hypothetical protein MJK12_02980, partial [Colwellia sp.]|nr:hypothetical protein [Colwellia sp.]
MKNKHEIIEKYLSSTWDRHSILGAVNIVQDRIDGIPACLLNKVKFISTENGKEAFNEGWEVTDSTPNNYSCVASMKNKHLAGDYLKTLFSAKGEPKIKYPLPVRSLTYFNLIEQLFDPGLYTFSGGQFLVKHKEKGQERINELLEEFANIEDKPMHYVLDLHYSNFQINRIEKASTQQVSLWVDELEQFAKTEKRIITD